MGYQYKAYQPSNTVINYKNRQDTATNNYNTYANAGYSQGAGGLGSQLSSAQSRLDALYRGNNLTQQFRYDKQRQYDRALNNITTRKAFKYDLSEDQLFQQAKEQYQAMGKTAMQDTMGQASAMTGGYGNSYATTAGNQAYQAYLTELNNSIGDYYAMALSAYNNETDRLNSVFSALSTDRSAKQNEWSNNWNVYNNLYSLYSNDVNNLRQQDLTAWQQKGANLKGAAELASNQYSTASGNDINIWSNQEKYKATQAEQAETERANRAKEDYNNRTLAEQKRANQEAERYKWETLNWQKNNTTNNPGSGSGSGSNNGSNNGSKSTYSSSAVENAVTNIREEFRRKQGLTWAQKQTIIEKYAKTLNDKESTAVYNRFGI